MFKSTNFREVPFLFTVLACRLSCRAFVVGVPIWCNAIPAFSFSWSLGLVLYFLLYVILCIGSSVISFSRFDIIPSGIVFFSVCLSYLFSCICSTVFGMSKSFASNSLFLSFFSVIDVVHFDSSNSVLKSGKSHSLSYSLSFSQCPGVFLYLIVPLRKNLLVSCFFPGSYLIYFD